MILSWPMAAMRFFDPLACLAERRGVLRPVSNSISFFLFLISFPFPTFLFSYFSYLQGCPRPKRKYGAGDTDTGPQGMGFPGLSRLFLTTRANEQTKDTDGVYEVSFFTSFSISDLLFSFSIFLCLLLSFDQYCLFLPFLQLGLDSGPRSRGTASSLGVPQPPLNKKARRKNRCADICQD